MQAARGASLNSGDQSTPSTSPAPDPHPSRVRAPRRTRVLFAVVAVLGYAADLLTKELALANLEQASRVPLVGDWLGLYLTFNSGAAFSLGTDYTFVISCVAVVAVVVTVWVARRLGSTGWALALGFLLAGVLGNLTDRIFRDPSPMRGHVVDFLQLPNFPVFNVADICINVAAGLVILQAVRGIRVDGTREPTRREREQQTSGGSTGDTGS
jgi:signal peptidase II